MLSAEEIITRIVQAFDLDDTAPSINWITLAVLARVSRAFSKPALDHLWSTLDDLDPLVRLLPEDAYLRNTPNLIFIVGGSVSINIHNGVVTIV